MSTIPPAPRAGVRMWQAIDNINRSVQRAFNPERCRCCSARVRMQCAKGTGFCGALCRRGKCQHPKKVSPLAGLVVPAAGGSIIRAAAAAEADRVAAERRRQG